MGASARGEGSPTARRLADYTFPELQHDSPADEVLGNRAKALEEGDPLYFYNNNGFYSGAIYRAACRVLEITEDPPETAAELAPYLFCWPVVEPTSSTLMALGDSATLLGTSPIPLEEAASHDLMIALDLDGEELSLTVPIATEEELYWLDDSDQPWELESQLGGTPITSTPSSNEIPVTDPRLMWDSASEYRDRCAYGPDARFFAAFEAVEDLLISSTMHLDTLAETPEEWRRGTGCALINLIEEDPEDADLILEWDEVQAFRLRLIFPAGFEYDTVLYINSYSTDEVEYQSVPTFVYLEAKGMTEEDLTPLNAWDLAQGGAITLPGIGN